MKDLKHYFAENPRSCEASNVVAKEVTRDGASDSNAIKGVEEHGGQVTTTTTTTSKKRGRVKIKISGTISRGKICDVIESDADLVDKTPSPFAPKEVGDDEFSRNETPKRTKTRCKTVKKHSSKEITISKTSERPSDENGISGDENDNLMSNGNCNRVVSISGSKELSRDSMEKSLSDISTMEREESNAFKVLMTRKKSIRYKVNDEPSPQDQELATRMAEEGRNKLKQNREKLTSLADKKGYSKRKLNELEEAEKIERRLEKRAKVFKQICKKETEDKNSTLSRRVSPGSLHNYFSKATPERREKDVTAVSSILVEAEVHMADSQNLANIGETSETKTLVNSSDTEMKESLGKMKVCQVPEVSDLPVADGESQTSHCRNKKPRWSLRINLQCNDRDNEAGPAGEMAEKIPRGKRDTRAKRVKVKTPNCEENESSESRGSTVKSLRRNKTSTNVGNTKSSSGEETRSSETPSEVSTSVSITLSGEGAEEDPEIEIIDVKVANKAEKLAPLFVKRQKPDPAVLEARRAFLQSVPTEIHDRSIERKVATVGSSTLPFPTISHVTQLPDVERKIDDSDYKTIFPTRLAQTFVPKFDLGAFKTVTSLERQEARDSTDTSVVKKSSIEEVLDEIESRCSDAREIWTRISSRSKSGNEDTKKSPKRRGKKKKSVERKIDASSNFGTSENCPWTEKYRPTSTRDIMGNEEGAEKFRKWLNGWRISTGENDNDSSGDDFYPSDSSHVSNFEKNQVAVLLGPHGSGKTASVYAIAEELGYSVIEVNASSKRAGKKILKELEEATKSHRIKRNDFPSLNTTSEGERKKIPQNSLILMEDIDLVFEEDEGFISATCQLASNTKRPIVMTGRNPCSHFNRMAPQQMRIYYETTVGSRVSALLELITLAESGQRLPRTCLDRLLQNGDLRKALLQLQYLLISGNPDASAVPTNFHETLWQDMRQCVYKPAIRGTKKSTRNKLSSGERRSSSSSSFASKEKSILNSLANDLDKLSLLSTMIEIDDPAIEVSSLKLEPSLSLDENVHNYSSTRVTSVEIAKWLRDRLMRDGPKTDCGDNDLQNFRRLSLKKNLNVGVNLALSQVSPHNLDRRSTSLDYLPYVRTICRAEESRVLKNNKRGNRFFHYLQNLRLPSLSTRPSVLSAACKMLREKDSES